MLIATFATPPFRVFCRAIDSRLCRALRCHADAAAAMPRQRARIRAATIADFSPFDADAAAAALAMPPPAFAARRVAAMPPMFSLPIYAPPAMLDFC